MTSRDPSGRMDPQGRLWLADTLWRIGAIQFGDFSLGRTVRNVKNGPSPQWLQDRLTSIGLRPINALVDITNFFTIDLGRPLHVFDADKIAGPTLTFRPGAGETFRGLHGRDITARPEDCIIADANGAQSLAGVVGGEPTSCNEQTTTVFIECAYFDPVRIALSGRHHGVSSDARSRFERGIDPALMPDALAAATAMVIALCGGEASSIVSAGAEPAWQRTATLRTRRIAELGGLDVPAAEAIARLERLGFSLIVETPASFTVRVPSWRNDIAALAPPDPFPALAFETIAAATAGWREAEPEADLIEEILRLEGLDAIPAVSMPVFSPVPIATLTPAQSRRALARRLLAAEGLAECVTFSFMPAKTAALFGSAPEGLRLLNPIAADLDQLRPTAIATLALAAARNFARGIEHIALFEIGPVFHGSDEHAQPMRAAGLIAGRPPRHWSAPQHAADAMDAKAIVLRVLAALDVPLPALSVTTDAPGFYHPGQSGQVRQGPKTILASFGVLHPKILAELDLPAPAIAFEIHLEAIQNAKKRKKSQPDLPAFQPVYRDFSFVVPQSTPAETALRAARTTDRTLIDSVTLFDIYEGDRVPSGHKALGLEVTIQPREKTLTDADIEAVSARIVAAVTKATGGALT